MIVGIDVGNTAIKWVTDGDSERVRVIRLSSPRAIETVTDELLSSLGIDTAADIRIASVNRSIASSLQKRLQVAAPDLVTVRLISAADVSIEVNVDHPERVGIDRLVGAWGACSSYPTPLMVVDAGTTVTVDLVDGDGVYQGGAILPGLEMQTSALARGTDALPRIDWQSSNREEASTNVVGKNTAEGIRLGILASVVGGVERLHRLYGAPKSLIVTGGDADCISAALSLPHKVEQQLVARTLLKVRTED